jgi:hypothetical protein
VTSLYLYGLLGISETALAPALISGRAAFYLINLATLLYVPFSGRMRISGAQHQIVPAEAPGGNPLQ